MKAKAYIALITFGVAISVVAVYFYVQYKQASDRNDVLAQQLNSLYDKEKKSVIMRSVSTQMEEIAYQQKSISDRQRMEARQQTVIANKMRAISDKERQKALLAEQKAVAAQYKAVLASENAESQRRLADVRRSQAEYAKRTADTLNANTLARSLGSLAVQRYQAKNETLGELLAYAAYYVSKKYDMKTLSSDVYLALSLAGNGNTQWNQHQGSVMAIAVDPNDSQRFVTVDNYGGIILHQRNGAEVNSELLINNNAYDFRDAYIDGNGDIYALSRGGQLYVKSVNGEVSLRMIPHASGMMRIMPFDNDKLLLVAEQALYVYDTSANIVTDSKTLNFTVSSAGFRNNQIMLFDKARNEYAVKSLSMLTVIPLPFLNNNVTAYTYSDTLHTSAYGTDDGIVYLQRDGGEVQKMESHRSHISDLQFAGNRLYSASFDGSVKFCDFDISPLEFSNAYSGSYWIYCLSTRISDDEIWTGNQHGSVTRTLVSTQAMAKSIKQNLKRNFSAEEWNKYIGSFLPYTKFK